MVKIGFSPFNSIPNKLHPLGDVVEAETGTGNLFPPPVSEMLSEPKQALAIYFHRRFRLSLPARDVGIKLKGENPILT
jgi:hypothetical protein